MSRARRGAKLAEQIARDRKAGKISGETVEAVRDYFEGARPPLSADKADTVRQAVRRALERGKK